MKDLGSCDLYPQSLQHNPNGRFVTVCGDGEYIIYTALAWRNKSFGSALEFVWGNESNDFAIRSAPCLYSASLLMLLLLRLFLLLRFFVAAVVVVVVVVIVVVVIVVVVAIVVVL